MYGYIILIGDNSTPL